MSIEKIFLDSIVDLIGKRCTSQGNWHVTHGAACGDWRGCRFKQGQRNGQLGFYPPKWAPAESEPFAWYELASFPQNGSSSLIDSAIGKNDSSLCFHLSIAHNLLKTHCHELRRFYATNDVFHSSGFLLAEDSMLYRPFVFNGDSLTCDLLYSPHGYDPFEVHSHEEYPYWPLENALKDLFAVHSLVSRFVKKLFSRTGFPPPY